jgi:hypothetical protein
VSAQTSASIRSGVRRIVVNGRRLRIGLDRALDEGHVVQKQRHLPVQRIGLPAEGRRFGAGPFGRHLADEDHDILGVDRPIHSGGSDAFRKRFA